MDMTCIQPMFRNQVGLFEVTRDRLDISLSVPSCQQNHMGVWVEAPSASSIVPGHFVS